MRSIMTSATNAFFGVTVKADGAVTIDGCNFSYCGHSVVPWGGCGSPLIIQNCYMDRLINNGNTHYEHIYYGGGTRSDFSMLIQNNTLVNANGWTATIFLKTDTNAIQNVTIQNNQLIGGGYTIYVQPTSYSITSVNVVNNVLGKGQYGYVYQPNGSATWFGNTDLPTGRTVTSTGTLV